MYLECRMNSGSEVSMMVFFRVQTRLFCDVYSAFRALSQPERIAKWSSLIPGHIDGKKHEKVFWSDLSGVLSKFQLTFYVMNCTEETEYCSEIHALLKCGDEPFDLEEGEKDYLLALMEDLRVHFNREWCISEFDLSHPKLLKSR